MKRIYLFGLASVLLTYTVNVRCQDLKENKKVIFPENGNWSIGIDAAPFLQFAGNIFSNSVNIAPVFGFTSQHPGTIYVKYVKNEKRNYRGGLKIGFSHKFEQVFNSQDNEKFDEIIQSGFCFGISAGTERHFAPKNRLKAYYGHEAGFLMAPYSGMNFVLRENIIGKLTYTNAFDKSYNFTETGGKTRSIFYQGFVGVEYFILPKISVNGEFVLQFSFSHTNERNRDYISQDDIKVNAPYWEVNLEPKASGDLTLNFYF